MLVQRACAWDSEGLRPRVQVDRAWNRAQRALLFDEEAAASGDSEDESEADYEDDGDLRGFIAEDDDCLAEVNGTFYRALDQAREGRDASLLSWAQGEPGSGSGCGPGPTGFTSSFMRTRQSQPQPAVQPPLSPLLPSPGG